MTAVQCDGGRDAVSLLRSTVEHRGFAAWALEALVGHVVPADAKRPPNTWSSSFYTSGVLSVFEHGGYDHGGLPELRRPSLGGRRRARPWLPGARGVWNAGGAWG